MPKPNEMPGAPVRVGVYIRVSSEEQVRDHYSLPLQKRQCMAKLDHVYGEDLYVPTLFPDDGIPGRYGLYDANNPRRKYRPQLTAMHDAFKRGELDVICIYRLTRLWRKRGIADLLVDEFKPYGLQRVISCYENIDFNTASGRFQLDVQAAAGAFEVEQLGEWTSDSLQERKRDGYPINESYGWRRQRDDEFARGSRRGFAVVPERAQIVRDLAERYIAGESVRSLVRWLNAAGIATARGAPHWSPITVVRLLGHPVHAGLVVARNAQGEDELIQGAHFEQRIYDPEVYHRVAARTARNKTQKGCTTRSHDYLLSGILKCGHCQRSIRGRRVGQRKERIYNCAEGAQLAEAGCTRNYERANLVEGLVVEELRALAHRAEAQAAAQASVETTLAREETSTAAELKALRTRQGKLEANYQHWSHEQLYVNLEPDEFDLHVREFREGKAEVAARITELEAVCANRATRKAVLERARELIADFDSAWEGLTTPQKRELMQSVVASATMTRLPDGPTQVTFTIRGFEPVTRLIGRQSMVGRPETGVEALTTREQAIMYHYAQGLDRAAIAKKLGVGLALPNTLLWKARKKLGCDTPEQAWEVAREFIEGNLHWLPLTGRHRKSNVVARKGPLLTDAQCRVLTQWRQGLDGKQIAAQLGITESTVFVQLRNCRERLGLPTNAEVANKAAELGLI